jgi:predicted GIY-YIG superfamily endonuclease
MGIVILGLFSNTVQGIEGAILLSISHGLVSPALFIIVTILYENHGTRIINYFRGLVTNMPIFTIFFFIFTLANCAVPLTGNFIGEFLSLAGAFSINPIIVALSGTSMILSAGYSFWLFNRISFGSESPYLLNVRDITRLEFFVLLPLAFITILLGIFPNIVLDTLHFSVSSYLIDTSHIFNSPPPLEASFSLISFIPVIKSKHIITGYNVYGRIYFSTEHSDSDNSNSDAITSDKIIKIINDPEDLKFEKKYFNLDNSVDLIYRENKGKAGVYAFRSQFNNKFYVGSCVDIGRRFKQHFKGSSSNIILQHAFKKYGTINFYFYVLEYTEAKKEILFALEQKYINTLNSAYNILKTAGSFLGYKHSDKTRAKLSAILKGRKHSLYTKILMSKAAKRKTIYTYSLESNRSYTFNSITEAAKFFNVSRRIILKYTLNNKIFIIKGDNWILSTKPFNQDQLIERKKELKYLNSGQSIKASSSSKAIYAYSVDNKMIYEFSSTKQAIRYFKSNYITLLRYIISQKLFRNKWYISFDPLFNFNPNLTITATTERIKVSNKTKIKIYVYSPDCSTLVYTFSSIQQAAKYLEISDATISKYLKNQSIFRNKWVFSPIPLEPGFQPLKLNKKKGGPKGTTIYIYSSDRSTLINTFATTPNGVDHLKVNHSSIMDCVRTGRLLKKKWFISFKPLSEDPNSEKKN